MWPKLSQKKFCNIGHCLNKLVCSLLPSLLFVSKALAELLSFLSLVNNPDSDRLLKWNTFGWPIYRLGSKP